MSGCKYPCEQCGKLVQHGCDVCPRCGKVTLVDFQLCPLTKKPLGTSIDRPGCGYCDWNDA